MNELRFDVAVIGAGTAGLTARRAAIAAGARTALIEAGPWGTTCVRVGCMPSKLLLTAARVAREARRAPRFGIGTGRPEIDGRAVMRRLHDLRDRFLRSIDDEVAAIPAAERIEGRARFAAPDTLLIDDRLRVQAGAIVIAAGARSSVPDALAPVRDRVLTSETVFELEDLPGSIAVVGAGPLGIELGAAFTRLGVRTAVFDHTEAIGALRDPEVARAARDMLASELELVLGADIDAAPAPDGARLRWRGAGGNGEAVFDRVLVAAGRVPNLPGLDLSSAGLSLDRHGVPEHDRRTLRCGDAAVFIAGDADHDLPVLHEASRQGRLAGANAAHRALGARVEEEAPPTPLSIVFTDPDMAAVGTPLAELGEGAVVGHCDFTAGRGLIEDRGGGMIRLYARRADRVIAGSEMAGPAVEHVAHLVAALVQTGCTVDQALALPFYHPTYEEHLKDCLRDLRAKLD